MSLGIRNNRVLTLIHGGGEEDVHLNTETHLNHYKKSTPLSTPFLM